MQKKPTKTKANVRAVYLRMEPELVAWLDNQAQRQRRSRAYVVSQAVRMMRAVVEQWETEANLER